MMARTRRRRVAITLALLAGSTPSVTAQSPQGPIQIPDAAIEPTIFRDLEGWPSDDHVAAFQTFMASCRPILIKARTEDLDSRPMAAALKAVCRRAKAMGPLSAAAAAAFFEANFRPAHIFKLDNPLGLLTGYYEPIVDGSRVSTPAFSVPLYRRPDDLAVIGGQSASAGFPNRAEVVRRLHDRIVGPYFDRGDIEDGALDGRHLEICWIKDPIDAMVIQLEGSARIRLEDGLLLRINYDAHNGFPFTPVGRVLIERNVLSRDELSLDKIRKWMLANPQAARDVRRANRSFVFFRIIGLGNEEEARGAQGVRLTPGRSIAVDKALHVYGTPFFIQAELPLAGGKATAFRRLMFAQDTGSAILGPARADLFFGAGEAAGHLAGRIRQQGRFVMLLPREIDPQVAGARMPLPRARPAFVATVARSAASGSKLQPSLKPARSASQTGRQLNRHSHREPR